MGSNGGFMWGPSGLQHMGKKNDRVRLCDPVIQPTGVAILPCNGEGNTHLLHCCVCLVWYGQLSEHPGLTF